MNVSLHSERMTRFQDAGLYVVTSEAMSAGRTTIEVITKVLDAGVMLVQLREKDLNAMQFRRLAGKARELTVRYNALLIINDHLDVAIDVGADGVHLGQEDMAIADARAVAPDMVIGASSHSIEEAVSAEKAGASYVNIGPLFPTGTKQWHGAFLGVDGLKRIAPHLSVPFTVMGGIKKKHIPGLIDAGAETIALVTEVTAAPDPMAAAAELLKLIKSKAWPSESRR